MTKEELQNKIGWLEENQKRLEQEDRVIRVEFSKILGAGFHIENDHFLGTIKKEEQIIYSWPQIFAEIGKLLNEKKQYLSIEKLRNIEQKMDWIEGKISDLSNGPEKNGKDLY